MKEGNNKHLAARCLMLAAGLVIMAFGVAFSIKASLGTSPISSVPYVTGLTSGLSVGTTTIMNCIFVAMQILILRRRYQWFQLLQIPAAVLFGSMIDLGTLVLAPLPAGGYALQWLLCAAGILLVALGVSVEVAAGLVTTAGEGVVLAVCQVLPVRFGSMKVAFDVTLVCLSVAIGLVFLGRVEGVREGTVAAAVLVGLLTRRFQKPVEALRACALKGCTKKERPARGAPFLLRGGSVPLVGEGVHLAEAAGKGGLAAPGVEVGGVAEGPHPEAGLALAALLGDEGGQGGGCGAGALPQHQGGEAQQMAQQHALHPEVAEQHHRVGVGALGPVDLALPL